MGSTNRAVFAFWILAAPTVAFGQTSLNDQISAVEAAQKRQENQQQSEQSAQRAAQQAYERRLIEQQRAGLAAQNARRAEDAQVRRQQEEAIQVQQQRKEAEALDDKLREHHYEDQLRSLEIQEKMLRLDAAKARVARTNEFIDQELKGKSAETDVIQSKADSSRNLSSGTKTLLEKTGEAEVKKQSGVFK